MLQRTRFAANKQLFRAAHWRGKAEQLRSEPLYSLCPHLAASGADVDFASEPCFPDALLL